MQVPMVNAGAAGIEDDAFQVVTRLILRRRAGITLAFLVRGHWARGRIPPCCYIPGGMVSITRHLQRHTIIELVHPYEVHSSGAILICRIQNHTPRR